MQHVDHWAPVSRGARWGGALTVLGCAVSIAWFDLPLTRWLHETGADRHAWMLTFLGIPVGVSTLMGLYLIVHMLIHPWIRASRLARRAFFLGVGMMVALAAKTMLKIAFGRTWPRLVQDPVPGEIATAVCNAPSCGYLNDGIHAFVPFAGSIKAYAAFPSGSTALLVSFVVPLAAWYPALRIPLGAVSLFALATYVMTNTHFVSDVIAGVYIGTVCGMAAVAAAHDVRR